MHPAWEAQLVFQHLRVVSGLGSHQNKNARRLPPAQRGDDSGRWARPRGTAAAAAAAGQAEDSMQPVADRGPVEPAGAARSPACLRSNGRGRARHGPGCASSASLRALVRAALAKGVPVLPAPDPPPPAADSERRPAANEAAAPPPRPAAHGPPRSSPVPPGAHLSATAAATSQSFLLRFGARSGRGRARPSRDRPALEGRGRAGGSHAPAVSARAASPTGSPHALLSLAGAAVAPSPCSGPPSPSAWRTLWPPGSEPVEIHLGELREEARPSGPRRRVLPKPSLGPSPELPLAVPLERDYRLFLIKKKKKSTRKGTAWTGWSLGML